MANPFGRGCPGPGRPKPPPVVKEGSIQSEECGKTDGPSSGLKKAHSVIEFNQKYNKQHAVTVCKINTENQLLVCAGQCSLHQTNALALLCTVAPQQQNV